MTVSEEHLAESVEQEVQLRMERLRADPKQLQRYGFGPKTPLEQPQWSEIQRVVTLEVQTELQRHHKQELADDKGAHETGEVKELVDRFELRREIGRGAQGRTYLGFDRQRDEKVAIKELLLRDVEDWKAIELFEREGQALKFLDHEGIPAYVDAFHLEEAGSERFFLVQEFVDGSDFESLIDQGLTIDEEEAKEILEQLLTILVYLQSRSPPVIHRDIKPSNVMQRGDGSLALIDFGAVQSVIPNERGGSTIIGTSGYMPMEQLMGRAEPATDIYAVGVTVIHLLSRRHPADLPIRELRLQFEDFVNISPRFSEYLAKMIAPHVEKRFSTAGEALKALHDLDRPELSHAAPSHSTPTLEPAPRPPRPSSPRVSTTGRSRTPSIKIDPLPRRSLSIPSALNPLRWFQNERFLIWFGILFGVGFTFLLFFGWPLYITWQDSHAESAVERGDFETATKYRQRTCNLGANRACAYLSAVAIDIDPELAESSARHACNRDIGIGCANYADHYLRRYTAGVDDPGHQLREAWRYAERGCNEESDTGCARLALAELYRENFDEAQRAAMRGLGINDRQPYPHKVLGITLIIEGDVDGAIRSFSDAATAAEDPQGREHPALAKPVEELAIDRLQTLKPYYPESRDYIEDAISRLQ